MWFKYSKWRQVMWILLLVAVVGWTDIPSPIAGKFPLPLPLKPVDQIEQKVKEQAQEMPPETVDRLGEWAYHLKLETVEVCQNPQQIELVNGVANRIIEAAKRTEYAKAAKHFKWEVTVISDENTVDAFAVPGGKIGVYTGIFRVADSEDKLAVVLGHEAVHALARHAAERMKKELHGFLVISARRDQLKKEGLNREATACVMAAMGIQYEVEEVLPFKREHELEADHEGLLLMARAGYNPCEAIDFWERMKEELGERKVPKFLSTHPSYKKRIRQLKRSMPKALEYYDKAKASCP